jgi:hypothetical protein
MEGFPRPAGTRGFLLGACALPSPARPAPGRGQVRASAGRTGPGRGRPGTETAGPRKGADWGAGDV